MRKDEANFGEFDHHSSLGEVTIKSKAGNSERMKGHNQGTGSVDAILEYTRHNGLEEIVGTRVLNRTQNQFIEYTGANEDLFGRKCLEEFRPYLNEMMLDTSQFDSRAIR